MKEIILRNETQEIILEHENCPYCGDAIIGITRYNQLTDGDDVRCAAGCGYESAISIDEEGNSMLQDD